MSTLDDPSRNGASEKAPWQRRMAEEIDEVVSKDAEWCQAATETPLPMEDNGSEVSESAAAGSAQNQAFRDARGRFKKGHKFARGNPFHRRMAAMRRAFACAVSQRQIEGLSRQLYRRAMEGDTAAAAVLLIYAIGKPEKVVDPDSVDVDQWRRLQELPVSSAELDLVWYRIPAQTACILVQEIWPVLVKQFNDKLLAIANGEAAREPDLTQWLANKPAPPTPDA